MTKKTFIIITCISTILCSCFFGGIKDPEQETKDRLSKIWQLSDILRSNSNHPSSDKMLAETMNNTLIEKGLVICLFPDGKVTEICDKQYKTYDWNFLPKDSVVVFSYKNAKESMRILNFIDQDNLKFLTADYKGLGKFQFIQADQMLKDYKEDPFYPVNNEWRIKPKKEETELELKKRIYSYIKHNAFILKAALERKSEIVSFQNSMGIIRIYDGGIGIIPKEQIPEEWKAIFYNTEQFEMAYEIYYNYLRDLDFHGKSSGNWIKDDYKILLSLYQSIDDDIH